MKIVFPVVLFHPLRFEIVIPDICLPYFIFDYFLRYLDFGSYQQKQIVVLREMFGSIYVDLSYEKVPFTH